MKFELRKGLFCDDEFLKEFLDKFRCMEKIEPVSKVTEKLMQIGCNKFIVEVFKDQAFDNVAITINSAWFSKLEMDQKTYDSLFEPIELDWKEYCAMLAFESVFCDLGVPEDYGFESWLNAYDDVTNMDLQHLRKSNGEKERVVEEYEYTTLAEALECEYLNYQHVLRGVKKFNVKLDTLEVV